MQHLSTYSFVDVLDLYVEYVNIKIKNMNTYGHIHFKSKENGKKLTWNLIPTKGYMS